MLDKVKALEAHIAQEKDRVAQINAGIAEKQRERVALYASLSPEEKAELARENGNAGKGIEPKPAQPG